MAINPKIIKKTPRPAKDLKKTDPNALRNKALREANKTANERRRGQTPRPAKDVKAGSTRTKFLSDAKAGKIKAATPKAVSSASKALTTTGSKALTTTGSKALTTTGSKALTTAASKLPSVGTVAAGGLGLASKAFLGAGSLVTGMVTEAKPAQGGSEAFWAGKKIERNLKKLGIPGGGRAVRNTSPTFPKGKGTPSVGTPAKTARKYDTAIGPQRPIMPSVSMAGGGVNRPTVKKTGDGGPKKKAGATTGAAPAGTGAKPKRKSHFQRRQAERYAIGSSGKSL